jgi:hypothetical protein
MTTHNRSPTSPTTSCFSGRTAGAGDTILFRYASPPGAEGTATMQSGQVVLGSGIDADFTTALNYETIVLLGAGSTPVFGGRVMLQ